MERVNKIKKPKIVFCVEKVIGGSESPERSNDRVLLRVLRDVVLHRNLSDNGYFRILRDIIIFRAYSGRVVFRILSDKVFFVVFIGRVVFNISLMSCSDLHYIFSKAFALNN